MSDKSGSGGGRGHTPRGFLVFLFMDTSSASSNTRFMYSSKPCAADNKLRRLKSNVTDQIRSGHQGATELCDA